MACKGEILLFIIMTFLLSNHALKLHKLCISYSLLRVGPLCMGRYNKTYFCIIPKLPPFMMNSLFWDVYNHRIERNFSDFNKKKSDVANNTSNERMNETFSVNFALAAWIGQLSCKNCLLNHIIKGNIEKRMKMTERRERRHRKLLNAFDERWGAVYGKRKH
jgi:hypothetical protein